MGWGKMLSLAALGVGAVAAAPFTGGGSVLGAATLAASLTGAGTVAAAAGAGAVGAAAGAYMSRKEEEKENEEIARLRKKTDKLEEEIKNAINRLKGDKEYFNYIISLTAIGLAMANADGKISPEEDIEIKEFIGGIASGQYPDHVKDAINNLYQKIPSFNTAISYLEKVDPENFPLIRDFLELIMEADGITHEKEEAFLKAFDSLKAMIEYKPEVEEEGDELVSQFQKEMNDLPKGALSEKLLESSKSAA